MGLQFKYCVFELQVTHMKCGCFVKNIYSLYCSECYDSLEEHINDLEEDDMDEYKANEGLVFESCLVKFYFDKFELKYVQNKLNELEEKINKCSKENIIEALNINIFNDSKSARGKIEKGINEPSEDIDDDEPSYDYTINEELLEQLSAKKSDIANTWIIGKQIEYSLKEIGYCEIYCED